MIHNEPSPILSWSLPTEYVANHHRQQAMLAEAARERLANTVAPHRQWSLVVGRAAQCMLRLRLLRAKRPVAESTTA